MACNTTRSKYNYLLTPRRPIYGVQDSIIVSQQALEAWLSTHCIATALPAPETDTTTSRSVDISISDILCEHNNLDPKAQKMKRINLVCISRLSAVGFAIYHCP